MDATEITWLATRVTPAQLARVPAFANALGLSVLADNPDQMVLQTVRGDVLEYCAPGYEVPDYLFAQQTAVMGFRVEQMDDASRDLQEAGFELVGAGGVSGPVRFQHFRGPDERIYGLISGA